MTEIKEEKFVPETKEEKFIRLGRSRFEKANTQLSSMLNLGSSNYVVVPEVALVWITTLRESVDAIAKAYDIGSMSTAHTPEEAEAPPRKAGAWGLGTPQWASVRDMAQECTLDELSAAMLIYLQRIEEELRRVG